MSDPGRMTDFQSPAGLQTSEEVFQVLRGRTADNARKVDAEIWRRGGCECAVLMSDASGFTRYVRAHGILEFLQLLTECYDALVPIITENAGVCLTREADNILAIFPDAGSAADAAVAMNRWLRDYNTGRPADQQFLICIGIDQGRIVRTVDRIFGEVVNIASKIGEDIAGAEEILITQQVSHALEGRWPTAYSRSASVGADRLELFKVVF